MPAPVWEGVATHLTFSPHLAGNIHASVRASGIEKEGSFPPVGVTSPMLVGRDRSFRK